MYHEDIRPKKIIYVFPITWLKILGSVGRFFFKGKAAIDPKSFRYVHFPNFNAGTVAGYKMEAAMLSTASVLPRIFR